MYRVSQKSARHQTYVFLWNTSYLAIFIDDRRFEKNSKNETEFVSNVPEIFRFFVNFSISEKTPQLCHK